MDKGVAQDDLRRFAVGVLGASGTTGVELVRRLGRHPQVHIEFATSREYAGKSLRVADVAANDVELVAPDDAPLDDVDVVFSCLPHGASASWVARAMAGRREPRVIDLSGDFRLRDEALHRDRYGNARDASLVARAVYGLTEFARDDIEASRLVANPGCYPTCAALAIGPLVEHGLIEDVIIIDAKSGVSGAGRSLHPATQFIAAYDDVRPYKLGREHRHVAEIEQFVERYRPSQSEPVSVIFNPHVVPIERGMLATVVVRASGLDRSRALELYAERYADEPFIEVLPDGQLAQMRRVTRTNRAAVGIHDVTDTSFLVVSAAIDNLVKGAAGQAIQNMNRMVGLPETTGFAAEEIVRQVAVSSWSSR